MNDKYLDYTEDKQVVHRLLVGRSCCVSAGSLRVQTYHHRSRVSGWLGQGSC